MLREGCEGLGWNMIHLETSLESSVGIVPTWKDQVIIRTTVAQERVCDIA